MENLSNLNPSQRAQLNQTLLDAEWSAVNALREVLGIARNGQQPTYQDTLRLAEQLSPDWFNPETSLLVKTHESKDAKYYRERAKLETKRQNREISPSDIIKEEISRHKELLKISGSEAVKAIKKKVEDLQEILGEFEPEAYSEDQAIRQDAFISSYDLPVSSTRKDYRQFMLSDDRALRIRMLHPNKPEHISGADVIYEYYSDYDTDYANFESVRLAAIQYKIWDKKNLYLGEREQKQITRLKNSFCLKNLCDSDSDSPLALGGFRLPNCSAFIRPTDKLQKSDSKLITSGYHIRVCVLDAMWEDTPSGKKKINIDTIKRFKNETLSHEVFQVLLKNEMLGSKQISIDSLGDLYNEFKIFAPEERVVIHAQDFPRSERYSRCN